MIYVLTIKWAYIILRSDTTINEKSEKLIKIQIYNIILIYYYYLVLFEINYKSKKIYY